MVTAQTSQQRWMKRAATIEGAHGLRVLLVDDSPTKALRTKMTLEQEGFRVTVVNDGSEALRAARIDPPDVVVSDVLMPNIDGFELCRAIRADERLSDTPIVLLTATFESTEDRTFALRVGADGYVEEDGMDPDSLGLIVRDAVSRRRGRMQPSPPALLDEGALRDVLEDDVFYQQHAERLRLRLAEKMHEAEQAYRDLAVAYDATLEALIAALDLRDTETELHSWRVTEYSLTLGTKLALPWNAVTDLERGALLHDLGKIGVPDQILRKPGPLDDDEWVEMKKHPKLGYDMLAGVPFLQSARQIVLSHHEQWNGTGYPRGLKGADIPVGARIFAVADTLDAITTDRPYRAGRSFEVALKEIHAHSGTQFDPEVVNAALTIEPSQWETIREAVELRRRDKKRVDEAR